MLLGTRLIKKKTKVFSYIMYKEIQMETAVAMSYIRKGFHEECENISDI